MKEDFFVPNFTQTPNYFFDELLKELSSTEVHVMCAIIRKTYGWHKAEDKISFSQLTQATGLALSTVQNAIKKLVDKGIVVSKIVDGIRAYSFIVNKENEVTSKDSLLENEQNNSYIPDNGIDTVQNNSYIPDSGIGVYRIPVTPPLPFSGNTERTTFLKKDSKINPLAGFLDKIYFDYDTNNFVGTEELNKYVVDEYLERIQHFGLDAQEIYNKACVDFVRRKNTRHEVKKAGIWLLSLFRDASFGDVYKYGATSQVEKNNFKVNYELYCSFPHFRDFRLEQRRFLIVKGKEYSFYSSPEIFREAFKDYEV